MRSVVLINGGYLDRIFKEDLGNARINLDSFSDALCGSAERLRTYYYHCMPYQSSPPPDEEKPKNIEKIDGFLGGGQSLLNWTQDLIMELGNADLYDKRIEICRYLYIGFPKSDPLYMCNLMRDEAESYFFMEHFAEGERLFETLLREFPREAWGDRYEEIFRKTGDQAAFQRARDLNAKAQAISAPRNEPDLPEIIQERLWYLQCDVRRWRRRAKRSHVSEESISSVLRTGSGARE